MVSGVQDQPGQHGEAVSLLEVQKLARHSDIFFTSSHKNESHGRAWWLMPVVPALWEAEVSGGQEFKSSLAEMGLTLSPRSECGGGITVACSLDFLGSELGFPYVAQSDLKLLGSQDLPTPASQSARSFETHRHRAMVPSAGVEIKEKHWDFHQDFGRPKQVDHLRSGVQDQLGEHDETISLLKTQKLAQRPGEWL
ncbi:hypothetical protein AAY473_014221 [Plecturocebus cupreus]